MWPFKRKHQHDWYWEYVGQDMINRGGRSHPIPKAKYIRVCLTCAERQGFVGYGNRVEDWYVTGDGRDVRSQYPEISPVELEPIDLSDDRHKRFQVLKKAYAEIDSEQTHDSKLRLLG